MDTTTVFLVHKGLVDMTSISTIRKASTIFVHDGVKLYQPDFTFKLLLITQHFCFILLFHCVLILVLMFLFFVCIHIFFIQVPFSVIYDLTNLITLLIHNYNITFRITSNFIFIQRPTRPDQKDLPCLVSPFVVYRIALLIQSRATKSQGGSYIDCVCILI